jgi:hypothetical protein
MRGRTLNQAFIILDEAQNSTTEQMFMFLTRLGHGSKAVITGDLTQIDLPPHKNSGLLEAFRALQKVDGIAIVEFQNAMSSAPARPTNHFAMKSIAVRRNEGSARLSQPAATLSRRSAPASPHRANFACRSDGSTTV